MKDKRVFAVASLTMLTLAGCATVPPLTPEWRDKSRPTVNMVVEHIACEISDISDSIEFDKIKDDVVTVLLTLQVDDALDLTPSLGLTKNLIKPAVSLVTTLNVDIGGARQRTFTTSYSFNVSDIENYKSTYPDCKNSEKGIYNIEGNLGIKEIIADGLAATDVKNHNFVIPIPSSATDKSGPSFGSKIQFIITQSITNLGPIWTLKYFKGGGGSNGLLNGKRLDTDSVLITFAPKPKIIDQSNANRALVDAINGLAASVKQIQADVAVKKTDLTKLQVRSAQLDAQFQLKKLGPKSAQELKSRSDDLHAQLAAKSHEVDTAEAALASSQVFVAAAEATRTALEAQAAPNTEDQLRSAAANAGQQLQMNMLLQNLTIGH